MTTQNKLEKIIIEELENLLSEKDYGFDKKKSAELKQDLAKARRETGKAGITNLERGSALSQYKKHMKAAEFVNTETGTLARLMQRVSDILDKIIAKKSKEGEVADPVGVAEPEASPAVEPALEPPVKAPAPAPRPKV